MKRHWKYGIAFLVALFLVLSFSLPQSQPVQAASTVEIGQVRTINNEVNIPVNIRDVSYLTSLVVEIEPSTTDGSVQISSFEPTGIFNGSQFRTSVGDIKNNQLRIDTISTTGTHVRLSGVTTIGYITVKVTDQFTPGAVADLLVTSISATGSNGRPITIDKMEGQIEHNIPFGDVLGENRPTAAGAMRILQHVKGDLITNPDSFIAADVDGDGSITQTDAMQILEYVAGKRQNFLTVGATGLDSAVLNSDYATQFVGMHGRPEYKYQRSAGRLPTGLRLDSTGELTGKPTKAGIYTFSIRVTDALNERSERQFTIEVIDSNIKSVDKQVPVYVKQGEVPTLPSTVAVTYTDKDKTRGTEPVVWDAVDTSKVGMVTVKGQVGDSGFTTTIDVHVVSANHLLDVEVNHRSSIFGDYYVVVVDVSADVSDVQVNNVPTIYLGNNRFSVQSKTFGQNSFVVITLYDRFGNLLETKQQPLQ